MTYRSAPGSMVFVKLPLFILFFLVLAVGTVRADDSYSGDLPPITVGSACSGPAVYHWSTETKTPWQASMLLAVPEGSLPEEWSGAIDFMNAFQQTTHGSKDINTMVGALLSAWSESFQTPALLHGKFDRSITTETRALQCIAGAWQIVAGSDVVTTVADSSDWVRIFQEAQAQGSIVAQDVADQINRILATVNSQPGADTRPFHEFTVTGS